ncbi:MAG: fibronectin type III domain-containing protein [Nitrospira defluvii]|nr:fibronectin type III domain-containing protein [Nitrospira defluvii]
MKRLVYSLISALLLVAGIVSAETFTWDCNTEADMKEYRGERSDNGGASWGVLFKKDHVPGCAQLSFQNTAYVKPGDKLGRLFACDTSGQCSNPSAVAAYKIATSPVVVRPDDVTGLAAGSLTHESAIITGTMPAGAKINMRYAKAPLSWGSADSATCEAFPCTITGLTPDALHEAQCIPYFGTMNQGAIYGNFCPSITFRTLPLITPPPPVTPGTITDLTVSALESTTATIKAVSSDGSKVDVRIMVTPMQWGQAAHLDCTDAGVCDVTGLQPDTAYVIQAAAYFGVMNHGAVYGPLSSALSFRTKPAGQSTDLEPRLAAVEARIAAIETMGAVLDEEMKEVRATLKAICRALGGNCP